MGAQQIGFAPMPAVALILSRLDRTQLGSFVEIAIELMDVADGNTDVETNGDELDGSSAEEDIWGHGGNGMDGPGCSLADAGEEDDHAGGNVDDEGENADAEDAAGCGSYGIDQPTGPLSVHTR